MLKRLLNMIKCTKTYLRKSDMCSGNAYRVTLTYKGHRCSFVFHDNYMNESKKKDFLYCLVLDTQAYESCSGIDDFIHQFGYDEDRTHKQTFEKGIQAYRECRTQAERLHRLFNEQEIQVLSTIE